jgi:hypothetical protein
VTTTASRIDPMNKGKRVLVFILISSYDHYIQPLPKRKNHMQSFACGIDDVERDTPSTMLRTSIPRNYASPKATTTMC